MRQRANMRHRAKFRVFGQTFAEIWRFSIFRDDGRRHLGFVMSVFGPLCKIWLEST